MGVRSQRISSLTRACIKWGFRLGISATILFALAWVSLPFPLEDYLRYDASRFITDRNNNLLRTTLNNAGQRCMPIRLEDAGEWIPAALVAAEDKRFHGHSGLDYLALGRAIWQMVTNWDVVSGASTLTTQTIRLVKPRPRNLLSKGIEAFRALQIEKLLTKEEILEQYLNRSPFGGNIVGIRAASLHYFSKEPVHLNLEEAALLAGLPQSPNRLRPDRHPERARTRRNHVLERMYASNILSLKKYKDACKSDIQLQLWTPPFRAPHFTDAVLQEQEDMTLSYDEKTPTPFQTRTSLDCTIQQLVEVQLARHPSDKASGAAVIVLDAPSGEVLAMIGSPDYQNASQAGQYNAALSPRSPGSTLKPFAYALAFDRGQLTPEEVLRDTPLRLPGYQPQNFDRRFRQRVSARQALVDSLNLPSIEVVRRIGQRPFLETLHDLGLSNLDKPPEHYGLNLILGGGEVRLLDLSRAYAKLAHVSPRDPLSSEAAWIISDILSGSERDFTVYGLTEKGTRPRISWKTGTSSRSRDAWTIAWNEQYVVGVWRGNPNGSPCPELTGISDAAPLALEIFANLPRVKDRARTPNEFLMLKQREVCGSTGLSKSKDCRVSVTDWYLPGISHNLNCKNLCKDKIETNADTEKKTEILRPLDGQTFVLLEDRKESFLILEAKGSEELYWFIDGNFFAKGNPEEILQLPLKTGVFEISCTTADGDGDAATIVVK